MQSRYEEYFYNVSEVKTIVPDEFPKFIRDKLKEREAKVIKKKDLAIQTLPEFVELFKNTSYVSCTDPYFYFYLSVGQNGRSNVLIRKNLKRSREEFEENQMQLGKEIITAERDRLEWSWRI